MKFWRVFVIAALLFLLLLSLRVLHYYFGNFYTASWEDYKRWYPRFYFIVFPAVKILPFAAGGCFVWLIRKHLLHAYSLVSKSIDRFLVNPLRAFPLKRYAVNLTVALLTVTMLLVLSEYALRKAGYKPDIRINSPYFMPVDSLYELSGFYADSNGILCISAEAAEFIGREIQSKNNEAELTPLRANQSPEVFYLRNHFLVLREKNYESEFKTFVESLDSLADTEDSEFVHAIHSYVLSPINSSGFKSIEFKKYNPKRKSILLLGDSFTWGHSAANITDCFADLLLAKGYVVYNSGITATDPAQYLQVAKVWVPVLEPDYVVVNFYMGNDIKYFKREPLPFVPVFYCTNAGNLISCPDGIYFNSPREAYDYSLSNFSIPKTTAFNDFCSKFVLTTLMWKALVQLGLVDGSLPQYKDYFKRATQLKTETPYSDVELSEIKKITEAHHGKFLLVIIPALEHGKFLLPTDDPKAFQNLEYFVPPFAKKYYHQRTDGHYNSSGHAMHAAFIDSLIRAAESL